MRPRRRVLLLIPHLGGGGAEQVACLLARGLSREKYDLHLGLVTQAQAPGGWLLPGATIHALGAPRVRAGAWRLVRLVWRLRPQVILSGMFHLNFLVLALRPLYPRGTRVLVRQNGTVSTDLAARELPRSTAWLYRVLYRCADRVIFPTRAMADDLIALGGLPRDRAVILPNPVESEAILAARHAPVHWDGPGPHLLAAGRLAHEKGFDLLLDAFQIVRRRYPTADLVIAGTGREEAALKDQCRRLGLDGAVRFPGHVDNPYGYFPGATLFVLSSRHEGMPNALLEAAAGGLPLVATPASGGVVALLQDRPQAWLAAEISAAALSRELLGALAALCPLREAYPSEVARRTAPALPAEFSFASAIGAYEKQLDALFAAGRP